MAKVYIGTSGFFYSHWGNGIFYPKDLPRQKWFEYYCQHFNTVELNVSFYRLPRKEIFTSWRRRAGQRFVFSLKGNRFITHIKKLKNCQEPTKKFFETIEGIREKKRRNNRDVILWQLPPGFKANSRILAEFLTYLFEEKEGGCKSRDTWRYAFEFRDTSWLNKEIYQILRDNNAAIVFQDYPSWPIFEEITADFIYLRFHGKTELYSSCYTKRELENWAKKIKIWTRRGLDCYAYFNNDAMGYAIENARQLLKLI